MELGSWADWVSGVSTAAAFATALFVIVQEKWERLTERAETLSSYLMMEDGADPDQFQSISLTIVSSGRDQFRQVRIYRIADIEGSGGRQRVEITGLAPTILPRRKLIREDVLTHSPFPRGVHQHQFSAMIFRFRGAEWITYADQISAQAELFLAKTLRKELESSEICRAPR